MKKEATVLNIICTAGAVAFLAFAAFNAITSGEFFTTDNLFLTVICLLFALVLATGPFLYLKDEGKLPLPFQKKALAGAAAPEQMGKDATRAASPVADMVRVHFAVTNKLFARIW